MNTMHAIGAINEYTSKMEKYIEWNENNEYEEFRELYVLNGSNEYIKLIQNDSLFFHLY